MCPQPPGHENTSYVTAILERVTGLTLLAVPSFVASVLLGSSPGDATGILVGRLAGITIASLAIASWFNSHEAQHAGATVKSLLFFNLATAALQVYAGINGFSGLGLWPACLLHTGMAAWCLTAIRKQGSSVKRSE